MNKHPKRVWMLCVRAEGLGEEYGSNRFFVTRKAAKAYAKRYPVPGFVVSIEAYDRATLTKGSAK